MEGDTAGEVMKETESLLLRDLTLAGGGDEFDPREHFLGAIGGVFITLALVLVLVLSSMQLVLNASLSITKRDVLPDLAMG